MNLESAGFDLVVLLLGSELLRGLGILLGGSLYDLRAVKTQRQYFRHPHAKQFRQRPLVSIIIVAENAEKTISDSLTHILKSSYRKFEIIVVDNASKDKTVSVLREFIKSHSKAKIKLVTKRKKVEMSAALQAGLKKMGKSQLVMALDGHCLIGKEALKNSVRHFAANNAALLKAHQPVLAGRSLTSVLERFESLSRSRTSKIADYSSQPPIGFVWRRGTRLVFERQPFYAHDVVVQRSPSPSLRNFVSRHFADELQRFNRTAGQPKWFHRFLASYGQLIRLAEPFLVGYFLYLAIVFQSTQLFALAWAATTLYLGFLVWSEGYLSIGKKLKMTLLLPVIFNLFCLELLLRVLVALFYTMRGFGRLLAQLNPLRLISKGKPITYFKARFRHS